MNDVPRQTLSRIIAKHGRGICDAPKRVEAMLRDLCGPHRREINIIVGALEERVAADLIAAGKTVPRDALLARLAARLRDDLAYTPEAARWGVETWAVALGILSEAEFEERARKESLAAGRGVAPPPARDTKPTLRDPPGGGPRAPTPRRGAPHAPPAPQQQRTSPPPQTASPPPSFRPPAPAPRRTPPAHPKVIAPPPPRQNVQPPPQPQLPSRDGSKLRGCLIAAVLIIALIVAAVFVVPAVIVLLQEEQARPSINEPRIR